MEDQKMECCEENNPWASICKGGVEARYKQGWYKSGAEYCSKHWEEVEYMLEDAQ
jgi:hypothetical protein